MSSPWNTKSCAAAPRDASDPNFSGKSSRPASRKLTTTFATLSASGEASSTSVEVNPLLQDDSWTEQPFLLPPFEKIQASHFPEAFNRSMHSHLAELQAIAQNPEPPTFENTVAAYDRAGRHFLRTLNVFSNLCSSSNTPVLQEVETYMSPILSRHESACYQNELLFKRLQTVYQQLQSREGDSKSTLTSEQIRLVERIYLDFTRNGGAHLTKSQQTELADLQAELASLQTEFAQNCLKSESEYELVLQGEDLQGCPESLIEAARSAAQERQKGEHDRVITLGRSFVEPFLTFADRRDLRKQVFDAWVHRGESEGNLEVAVKILRLRRRVAQLQGFSNYASYQLVDRMAQTPQAVMELLENVWERAKEATQRELQAMQAYAQENEDLAEYRTGIEAHDWRYIAEKVRKAKYDMDESLLKPYLSLASMRDALFAVSNKLFGLRFVPRHDLISYHPDVETYEVHETLPDGSDRLVAVFLHDNFARRYKRSGAWMSEYRTQTRNLPAGADPLEGVPIVINNNNFVKGRSDATTLLSFDDAHTLFHEFGHAHHGLLSNATYHRLASTNVLTDFVELQSQLLEHWLDERQILQQFARHYETGEPVPDALLDRMQAARLFQQGFQTLEYTACALLDMAVHQKEAYEDDFDLGEFERTELGRLGMPSAVVMRHRPAHFLHLFASSMYAAGYYVYLWAQVLDCDAFAAFEEAGDIFDAETSDRLRQFIYSSGNTEAPGELFRQFRGRDPKIEYMLRHKGLAHVDA